MPEEQIPVVEQQEEFNPDKFMGTDTIEETPMSADPAETPAPPAEEQAPAEVQFDEYFSAFREEVGELDPEVVEIFKNGKDAQGNVLTPKTKLNILKDHLLNNVLLGGNEDHDAFIRDYMRASASEDFDRSKWLDEHKTSQDIMKLPAKDFLKTYYKRHAEINKLSWNETDINSKVDGMNAIDADMEAQRLRGFVKQQMQAQQQEVSKQNLVKQEARINELIVKDNENIQKDVTTFIAQAQAKKVIGGFEFGDADKKEFLTKLPEFTKRKIVTLDDGRRLIASEADMVLEEIKAKPVMSLNMLPYLYLIKTGKMDGYMSRVIESKKKQLEDTLEDTPGGQINRGSSDTPGFNPDRFMGGGA